jgi:hypothetical protein
LSLDFPEQTMDPLISEFCGLVTHGHSPTA